LTDRRRTPQSYEKLFHRLFSSREPVPVRKPGYVMFRTMQTEHIAGTEVLKGHLCKFTKLESDRWLNINTGSIEEHAIPAELFPNLKEMEYVFLPRIHRFCLLVRRQKAPLVSIRMFLERGLNRTARDDEEVHVTIEKSHDFLEEILEAPHILNIDFQISFSNQDLNDEYTNLVDNQLRDAEIEYLQISGRAREGKSVELQKSTFLMGAVGLVPSNGHATARIVNRDGYQQWVRTSDYPRQFRLQCSEGQKTEAIVRHLLQTYPRADEA
jgi:hypothetical protein